MSQNFNSCPILVLYLGIKITWFVDHWNPWFHRGGGMNVGSDAGVFDFNHDNGHANSDISFRVVCILYLN